MRRSYVLAIALAAVAVLLPPATVAVWLTSARPDLTATVTAGAWLFKGLLLVHATGVWAIGARWRPAAATPLVGSPAEPRRVHRHVPALLALVLIAGLAVRLPALDQGLWYDEVATLIQQVRLPVEGIITTHESQNQHPVYSLTAHASVGVFGESAWALRLPAVLFGVGSLAALWAFGRRIASSRETFLAVGLLALSYHHVWFSQNARGYTALLLGTLLLSLFFLDLLRGDGRSGLWPVVGYAVTAGLTLYTNATAAFVIAAHAVIWFGLMVKGRAWRTAAHWRPLIAVGFGTTLGLQLYALVLPQFLDTLSRSTLSGTSVSWKNPLWFVSESVRGLAAGLPGGLVGVMLGAMVAVAGLWAFSRHDRVAAAVMVLPGLLLALALLVLDHNLWPRLFFFSFGFAALIMMRGLTALARVAGERGAVTMATGAGVLLVAASAVTVPRAWGPKQDYEGARRYVEARRAPGDAVVTVDLSRYPYSAYLPTDWTPVAGPEELEAIEQRHRRTWVLYTFPARLSATQPEIWRRLQQDYRGVVDFPGTVGGGDVVVKVRG